MTQRFQYLKDPTQLQGWAKVLIDTLNSLFANFSPAPAGLQAYWHQAVPPLGWLASDGSSRTTISQPTLFVAIGYTYGGAGANFNLPPAQAGKFPIIKA